MFYDKILKIINTKNSNNYEELKSIDGIGDKIFNKIIEFFTIDAKSVQNANY